MSDTVGMAVAGLLTVTVNYIAVYMIFPCRYDKRLSVAITIIFVAAFYSFLSFSGLVVTTYGGFRGLIHFPLIVFLFRGQFYQKTFATFLLMLLSTLQIQPAKAIARVLTLSGSEKYYSYLIVILLIIYIIYICLIFKFGRRLFEKLFITGRKVEWGIYSLGAMFSFTIVALFMEAPIRPWLYMTLLLFVIWTFAILCFAIINTHEKTKQRSDADFARGIVSSGRDHYQKMNEMYDKLRILRHDYKYHLNAARKMLGASDMEGADKYLTGVEQKLAEIDMKKYCINSVINALVASYAERCAELGITFDVNINVSESLGIPNYDLCVILGNLLENSVEACAQVEHRRMIKLETQDIPAQLLIMVRNNYNSIIYQDDGTPVSVKAGGGFGLKSVKEVIARHGGTLTVEWDKDTFTAFAAVRL